MFNKSNYSQLFIFLLYIIIIILIYLLLSNFFTDILLCDSDSNSNSFFRNDENPINFLEELKNSLSKQYKKYRIILNNYNHCVKINNVMLQKKIEGRAFYYRALSLNIDLKQALAKIRRLEERIKKIDPNFKLITRKQPFERDNWFRKIK